jgi:hypothetical protein
LAPLKSNGFVAPDPTSFANACAVGINDAPTFSVPLIIDCTVGLNVVVWLYVGTSKPPTFCVPVC